MFRDLVRRKYNECCTKEAYINFRKELENFGKEKFNKEVEFLSRKYNPLKNIIISIERKENIAEKYFDFGKYVLVKDKYADKHYLLIPKDLSYFNVLTLNRDDVNMLYEMKNLIECRLGKNYILFFHCYPYNSVHTLHMHVVQEDFYVDKNNNLLADDVISVLLNE